MSPRAQSLLRSLDAESPGCAHPEAECDQQAESESQRQHHDRPTTRHGLARTGRDMDEMAQHLASRYRVTRISVDVAELVDVANGSTIRLAMR